MADHVYKLREVPKGDRWKYFWEYYKYHTIGGVLGAIVLLSLLQTVVFAPKVDMVILTATQTYVTFETWQKAEEALGLMELDLNGDGKVLIDINDNHVDPSLREQEPETYIALQSKLMASLSTAESALQIVDENTKEYFQEQGLLGTYAEFPEAMGRDPEELIFIPLAELVPFKNIEGLPEGLYMTLRPEDAMQIFGREKKLENFQKQVDALLLMMQP